MGAVLQPSLAGFSLGLPHASTARTPSGQSRRELERDHGQVGERRTRQRGARSGGVKVTPREREGE
jgi:hypothetical protein